MTISPDTLNQIEQYLATFKRKLKAGAKMPRL